MCNWVALGFAGGAGTLVAGLVAVFDGIRFGRSASSWRAERAARVHGHGMVVEPPLRPVENRLAPPPITDASPLRRFRMRSERINFLAVVTAGAGLVGFIGVFADWYSLSYQTSGAKVVIDFYGTADATGAIAVAASLGALLFGCAYILLQDPPIRKITALLMVLSSIVLLISASIGFTRVDEAVGAPNPFLPGVEGQATYTATVAVGLWISFAAGIIATVASVLLVARREAGTEDVDAPAPTESAA